MKRAGGYGHSEAFNREGSRVPFLSRTDSGRVSFSNKLISIKDSASYISQMPSAHPILKRKLALNWPCLAILLNPITKICLIYSITCNYPFLTEFLPMK